MPLIPQPLSSEEIECLRVILEQWDGPKERSDRIAVGRGGPVVFSQSDEQ